MRPVTVLILHPPDTPDPSEAVRWLQEARTLVADAHRAAFEAAGAETVRIVTQESGAASFGERIRGLAREVADRTPRGRRHGLVVTGSGALPLARASDLADFVRVARSVARRPVALANSYYSADIVAIPDASILASVPDLPTDNALPRWLSERAGIPVRDKRSSWRLSIDIDSPLDVLLVAGDPGCPGPLRALAREIAAMAPDVGETIRAVGATLEDRRAELLVAGRSSARTLRWLETRAACRVRALIEERGLRSGTSLALGDLDDDRDELPAMPADSIRFGPPRSVLGLLLDEAGPKLLPSVVAQLGDAAILDTRVLLAHRHGLDERRWPPLEDRLASDMLRPGEIGDPWLRQITRRALEARTPMLLGGHTLVGPGLPLIPGVVRWLNTEPSEDAPDEPGPEPEPAANGAAPLELRVQDEHELIVLAAAEPGSGADPRADHESDPEAVTGTASDRDPEPEPVAGPKPGAGPAADGERPVQASLWDS